MFNKLCGGFNPMTMMDNFKADGALGLAKAGLGMAAMSNPTIALATQLAGQADKGLMSGSPFADLLGDTQGLLSAMANPSDGLGWAPQDAQQLLGRIGQAFSSGMLQPEDAGLLAQASGVIAGNLANQPGGEADFFGGAFRPNQPAQNPILGYLAGLFGGGSPFGPY